MIPRVSGANSYANRLIHAENILKMVWDRCVMASWTTRSRYEYWSYNLIYVKYFPVSHRTAIRECYNELVCWNLFPNIEEYFFINVLLHIFFDNGMRPRHKGVIIMMIMIIVIVIMIMIMIIITMIIIIVTIKIVMITIMINTMITTITTPILIMLMKSVTVTITTMILTITTIMMTTVVRIMIIGPGPF